MAFPASITLYPNNDQYVELDGLADGLNPAAYQNAATVSVTIYDSGGNPVTNATNIAMTYVSSTNGVYRGQIPNSFTPATGTSYTAQITAVSGGLKAQWTVKVNVITRIS